VEDAAARARAMFALCSIAAAQAAEPIKIGFSMELTGPFAVIGKTGLLAFKIWEEEINAKGGLLGRRSSSSITNDQSNPATVPGSVRRAAPPLCPISAPGRNSPRRECRC